MAGEIVELIVFFMSYRATEMWVPRVRGKQKWRVKKLIYAKTQIVICVQMGLGSGEWSPHLR